MPKHKTIDNKEWIGHASLSNVPEVFITRCLYLLFYENTFSSKKHIQNEP